MDVQKKLDDIVAAVGSARSVPMSASCVINRAELLAKLEDVRTALPGSLAQARELLGGREQMVEEARAEAERIIESAHSQRGSLISDTEVARQAQDEADRILAEARREAEEIRVQADDYVDSKLANFEVVLTKTIGAVDRGRDKLLGRGPALDELGQEDAEAPERSADPDTLRERADAYVDAKFGAFQAVLTKTLEAVGRGRDKLQGARAIDELGAHLAAQHDPQTATPPQADAEYLAGLAGVTTGQDAPPAPPHELSQEPQPGYYIDHAAHAAQPVESAQAVAYQQPAGGYAYQQPDQVAYPQHPDPYGYDWQAAQQPAAQLPQQGYDPSTGYHPSQLPPQSPQPPHSPQPHGGQPGALDETSLFDTSLINLDQLRQYEQGRQH